MQKNGAEQKEVKQTLWSSYDTRTTLTLPTNILYVIYNCSIIFIWADFDYIGWQVYCQSWQQVIKLCSQSNN